MTYTALAVLFLLVSVGVGARSSTGAHPRLAIGLATVMVAAQFALLMSS
jgi:hypothetical protein